jgi:hydroxyethylthiazole kinase-like uncharacterized protein yjeF
VITAHAVADVRAAEHALMAQVPDGALMQRAATGLAVVCVRLLGRTTGSRVVLLVGAGDNGGDTLFAGARLAARGARVRAVLLDATKAHAPGLAALRAAGGRVVTAETELDEIAAADLVLDGIVGIGGKPGLRPAAARLARAAATSDAVTVAVDLPSGVEVDTGRTPQPHVTADVTVTFGTHKVCHLVDPAASACGAVHLVDIGLGPLLPEPAVESLDDADVAALLPVPRRDDDKYRRGVLGIHAGAEEYAGASVLATTAAIHSGAGMVRVLGEAAVTAEVRRACPEAVLADGRVQASLAGPGMDPDRAVDVVPGLIDAGVPLVLDAGALAAVHGPLRGDVLLTPHAGELARLMDLPREAIEADRLGSVTRAAARFGATVLLKGSTTLVATPDGRVRANGTGTSWLATAGSGDVLAGLAGALLCSGLSPLDAGSVAAHVHGLAGRLAASRVGAPSATDVLAALPAALLALRLGGSSV